MEEIKTNKKAAAFWEDWAEIIALMVLVIGFLISLSSGSAFVGYVVVFLCGMMFGRIWFRIVKRKKEKVPIFIIITGFLIGYVLGTMYGDLRVIVVLFILGIIASYWLHKKEIITSTEY